MYKHFTLGIKEGEVQQLREITFLHVSLLDDPRTFKVRFLIDTPGWCFVSHLSRLFKKKNRYLHDQVIHEKVQLHKKIAKNLKPKNSHCITKVLLIRLPQ